MFTAIEFDLLDLLLRSELSRPGERGEVSFLPKGTPTDSLLKFSGWPSALEIDALEVGISCSSRYFL